MRCCRWRRKGRIGCNTVLCVWRYKTFHTAENLEEKKEEICEEILDRKAT